MVVPLAERLIVRPITEPATKNGIYMPQSTQERGVMMRVENIGEVNTYNFVVGDVVIISKYAGIEIRSNNEKCYVVNQNDVLAKLKGGELCQ